MEKSETNKIEGYLLINKPTAISTFDLVKIFKRQTRYKGKIGHGGTLDVFASGLVVLLLGKNYTTKFDEFKGFEKEYNAGVRLGWSTLTLDVEGEFLNQNIEVNLDKEDLKKVFPEFLGKIVQDVPVFSAVKSHGVMYKKARKGETTSGKTKEIEVKSIELVGLKKNLVNLSIVSSGGTYVRQLTYDIFKKIGYESFLYYLNRVRVGGFLLKNAIEIDDLRQPGWEKHVISDKIA